MGLSTYAELQTSIANFLNRGDLTSVIPDFITLCESYLNSEDGIKLIQQRDYASLAEGAELPSDFKAPKSLYHDGPTYFGPLDLVRVDELGALKGQLYGDTGVPQAYAVVGTDPATIRFAPEPNGTYPLRLVYEGKVDALSDSNTTNTVLTLAPDLYLYGSLVAAEPYIVEDERLPMWKALRDERIASFNKYMKRREYGGRMSVMPRRSIGSDV